MSYVMPWSGRGRQRTYALDQWHVGKLGQYRASTGKYVTIGMNEMDVNISSEMKSRSYFTHIMYTYSELILHSFIHTIYKRHFFNPLHSHFTVTEYYHISTEES